MKRIVFTICILALLGMLTACAAKKTEQDTNDSTVLGLNDLLETFFGEADNSNPDENGTPDPEPMNSDVVPMWDYSMIVLNTEKKQYSSKDDVVVQVTNHMEIGTSPLQLHYLLNLETWDGTEWKRLSYYYPGVLVDLNIPFYTVDSGQTTDCVLSLSSMYSPLFPGTYRVVVYAGYEHQNVPYKKLYAEFELVE